MNVNRKAHTAVAGLITCVAAATASAQPYIQHVAEAAAGAVSQVSIANLKPNWVVTAVCNSSGNLELGTWQYANNALTLKSSAQASLAASKVAIADLSSSRVVTAHIDPNSNLVVEVWSISSTGAIGLEGGYIAEAASTVDIARLSSQRVVTAVRDSSGNLTLHVWGITSSGTVNSKGIVTDGAVSKASVTSMSSSQFVTAVQTSTGNLMLSSWAVDSNGNITYQADANKGTITQVDVTAWGAAGHVGTAVRNGSLNLEVLDWLVDPTTGSITLQASKGGGAATKLAVSTIGTLIFTAAKDSSGKLSVGTWAYGGSTGTQFLEEASLEYDAASIVAAAPLGSSTHSVTASVNGSGHLELNVWLYGVIH